MGLKRANPGLGRLVQSSVDGLYGVLKDELPNEASRAYLRVCTYFGTFLILRALDPQVAPEVTSVGQGRWLIGLT